MLLIIVNFESKAVACFEIAFEMLVLSCRGEREIVECVGCACLESRRLSFLFAWFRGF